MRMTSVAGHLMEMDFQAPYNKWRACPNEQLYTAPIVSYVPDNKKDVQRNLQKEARGCQWLVLWLDCDREGEAIAFEVIEACTQVNSRLQLFRAYFSTLRPPEIRQAVAR